MLLSRALILPVSLFIQAVQAQTVLDGAFIKENSATRRAIPYDHLREADVMLAMRVWRQIDLREKVNMPLYYPLEPANGRTCLFDVIRDGLLKNGSLTAYDGGVLGQDDVFSKPLTTTDIDALLNRVDSVDTPSLDDPDIMIRVAVPANIGPSVITRYQIKEDWIFDKQRGVMEVRIIGLAPMREVRTDSGELLGHAPLFWLYFPELRYVLANEPAFNRQNDGEQRTFDHFFQNRLFSSTITKVTNVYDRPIIAVKTGMDALLEAERVKDQLFTWEHDHWNF